MAFWPKQPDQAAEGTGIVPAPAAPAPVSAAPAPVSQATPADPTLPQLSPDQMKKMAETSKRFSAAFGEIVSILMRTPAYARMPLADLEWLVVPAVATGQFTLAEGQSKANGMVQPLGVVMWARVSDEIDARMSADPAQPVRLKADEWATGNTIWVIEAVGDGRVVEAMLKRMSETSWAGRTVKFRARNKDGQMVIGSLPPPGGSPQA